MMDASEYLERIGQDFASPEPASWEREALTERDWSRIERGREPVMLRVPWDERNDHTDRWRTV